MPPSPLDKQTAGCKSPHDWLVRLAIDLATLICVICGAKNGAIWLFSALPSLCLPLYGFPPAPPANPIEVLVVLAMPVLNYLKWWAIQLAIDSTVGT